ncbi:putative triacylglycerol lipase [Rosa chinensis]|uniref:Putative triacylglycerol lipase n=1 Tax=Rosa chinensis TaxID=74649 RepID=A0A2P6QZB3_ROSCH|nr:putative triacylglycerol lipase [Rosa chinensis]
MEPAIKLLRSALFSVTIGSNDFINNYLAPVISEAERKLRLQITDLFWEVNQADPESCSEFSNQLAQSFNGKLRILVPELNKNLPGVNFVYADIHSIVEDIIETTYHMGRLGFENTNPACCRVAGRYGGLIPCGPQPSKVCVDRSKYMFWDPYHPSDASNTIIARRLLYGNSSDISPMNVLQLLQAS